MKRKFTMVEMLVVMAVIAVLMTMLLPALSKARETAMRISCVANLKQIGVGLTGYFGDSDGYFPAKGAGGLSWVYVFQAGGYVGSDPKGWPTTAGQRPVGVWACPVSKLVCTDYRSDYGLNPATGTSSGDPGTDYAANRWKRINQVAMPSRVFQCVDSIAWNDAKQVGRDVYQYIGLSWCPGGAAPRHAKQSNMLYVDAHAQTINPYLASDYPNALNGFPWQAMLPWDLAATK